LSDLTIICGDGGLQGGFIAGAFSELIARFPAHVCGAASFLSVSASVGGLFYYLSHGENHPGSHIWTKELASREFSSGKTLAALFERRPVYDIDYMVDVIFRQRNPLDVEKIKAAPQAVYVPILNYDTLEVEYFTNRPERPIVRDGLSVRTRDLREYDVYDLIRASNAAPVLYDKVVYLGGRRYVDAGQLEPYAVDVPAHGKKLLIVNRYDASWLDVIKYGAAGFSWANIAPLFDRRNLRREIYAAIMYKPRIYNSLRAAAETLRHEGRLFLIKPSEKLRSRLKNGVEDLRFNFEAGRNCVRAQLAEIKDFVASG
jgi:predicted patatin/cPLA2 family phospholipase